jgi:tetratricopeptide (TPR) repeat protein
MDSRIAIIAMMLALTSCQQQNAVVTENAVPADRPERVFENAASFLVAHHATRRGDVEQAARQYTNALIADPNNINLLEQSFWSFYLNGQIENAASAASKLEQQDNPVSLGSEPIAAITARARDWAGLEVIARYLNEDATSRRLAIILEAWALAFQQRGDAGLSRLLDLSNGDDANAPQRQLMFGQTAAMMDYLGRRSNALTAARAALEQPALNDGTILSMASIFARNGAEEDAVDTLNKHLSLYFAKNKIISDITSGRSTLMDRPDQFDLLVDAIIAAGQSDQASSSISFLARLRLAAHIKPDHDLLRYHLGSQLRRRGDAEEGFDQYRKILPQSPWYQPAMLFMALHRSLLDRDFDVAAELFQQILDKNPENPVIWHYFGDAARQQGDHEQALSHYERAIAYGGDRAKLEYKRGISLDSLERYDEAMAALRQSINLDATDAYVLNYLGYQMLEHGGNAEEALKFIRAAVATNPKNGSFMDSLGWGYYRIGQYEQAVQFLERAIVLQPTDPIITDHLGDAYQKVGRLREAIYQWQRVLEAPGKELDPTSIASKISSVEALINP